MNQINVQRWASSLRQFRENYLQPSIVTDVYVGSQNGGRNVSTTMKIRENESPYDNHKYSFTLDEKRSFMSEDSNRTSTKDEEQLHSPQNDQFSDNHHDIDTLSDAGTYIIEDDESEQRINSSSSFNRYINPAKHRHGTFDLLGLISSTAHTIHRPIVDSNIPKQDLSLSSSNSSLLSFNEDENVSENKSSLQQRALTPPPPPPNQIKPAECFVISPTFETKSFSTTNAPRRKVEAPWKSKLTTKSVPTKDSNLESILPSPSPRSNQNSIEKYSFHLQKQPPPPLKTSTRPHTATNDQTSSFQRNSSIRQTIPENPQHRRQTSSLSTIDNDETTLNLTRISPNKSFLFRQQRSNVTPPTSKPLKSTSLAPSSITNFNSQTNRAVELRRARAQQKIEELAQRTKKQLHKPNHPIDIMSASWHSNASNTSKKDFTNPRTTARKNPEPQKQDLSATRTISSSLYQRSSSASPNPSGEIQEQQYQKLNASIYSIEGERCDSLRDNGQRLAIKLIQLSSGILEKLKPNDDVSISELEQLVDKLQMVNRTLSSIDASLTSPTNADTFI